MHTARHARSVIDAVCDARPSNVVIDLSRLEFVDSHGLHLMVLAHRTLTAAGCSIALVAPPAHIRRAFAIAGLDGVENDCADALRHALITDADLVPAETLAMLEPILGKYLDRSGAKPAWKR